MLTLGRGRSLKVAWLWGGSFPVDAPAICEASLLVGFVARLVDLDAFRLAAAVGRVVAFDLHRTAGFASG
jgi:hypothetical protein